MQLKSSASVFQWGQFPFETPISFQTSVLIEYLNHCKLIKSKPYDFCSDNLENEEDMDNV